MTQLCSNHMIYLECLNCYFVRISMNSSAEEIALKILMIGDSGVGKSRFVHLPRKLLNRLLVLCIVCC